MANILIGLGLGLLILVGVVVLARTFPHYSRPRGVQKTNADTEESGRGWVAQHYDGSNIGDSGGGSGGGGGD